jgi:hypothetical protein
MFFGRKKSESAERRSQIQDVVDIELGSNHAALRLVAQIQSLNSPHVREVCIDGQRTVRITFCERRSISDKQSVLDVITLEGIQQAS